MTSSALPPLVEVDVSNISLALLVLGAYVCCIGQLSHVLKEKAFVSSALVSLLVGVAFGPRGTGWVDPLQWTGGDAVKRNELTFQLCRLVIGIQVMFAGISLPAAYLKRQWKSLAVLLLPVMLTAWLVSAALVFAIVRGLTFLEALAIAACITPTDPVLANSIVKGKFAEKYVPVEVRDIISAESGANDGLGYPFIFLAIFLMSREEKGIAGSLREWVISTWLYEIFLSCALGALIGFVARKTLKEAHHRQYIDRDSFLAYGIGLALLTLGLVGIIGSDDLLACFVAGNSLTWQDFYRVENLDDSFQGVIDSLLDAATFIYLGAVMPWSSFADATLGLSVWRLVVLAALVLLLRRPPFVMALWPIIPSLKDYKEAAFAGWFGPIGISAVYYAILATERLPEDRDRTREVVYPVVLFMALASTVAHGITIPLARFGPKLYTRTRSSLSLTTVQTTSIFRAFARPTTLTNRRGFRAQDGSAPSGDPTFSLSSSTSATGASTPVVAELEDDIGLARLEDGAPEIEGAAVAPNGRIAFVEP